MNGAVGELVEQRFRELSRTRLGDILGGAPHLRTFSPALERSARERRGAILEELEAQPARQAELAAFLAGATRDFLQREHPHALPRLRADFVASPANEQDGLPGTRAKASN